MKDPQLNLRMFGSFRALRGQETLPRLNAHAQHLLAVLGCSIGRPTGRSMLADLIWPSAGNKGKHSLSQLLYGLRRSLPARTIIADASFVELNNASVRVDIIDFNNAMQFDQWATAIELYAGPFLDGIPYVSDELDDWRLERASSFESDVVFAYRILLENALAAEDHVCAAGIAQRALSVAPLVEQFAAARVQSLAAAGEVTRALRELESFRRRFLLEVGLIPASLSDAVEQRVARMTAVGSFQAPNSVHVRTVGRTLELAEARRCWSNSAEGCQFLLLRGEPGIGKTRVFEHTVKRAVLEGGRAFVHTAAEVEESLPYSGVVGIMREGIRDFDASTIQGDWRQILSRLAPELFPGVIPGPPNEQPRIIWEAVVQFFLAAATRERLIIGIDNYQWFDDRSVQLLAYMFKRLIDQPILIICAGRNGLLPHDDSGGRLSTIELRELSREAVAEVIDEFESRYAIKIAPSTRHMLTAQVGGRPFFLIEALRQLRESGGASENESLASLFSSGGVAKQIVTRVQHLQSAPRSIAFVAALINREMPLHLLARITQLPPMCATEAAVSLMAMGIFADAPKARFAHDLMRELALRAMNDSERVLWHARIAETLETSKLSNPKEIAAHYERAGEHRRAYTFAKKAAMEAMAFHAYADAEEEYVRMLRCASPVEQHAAEGEFVDFVARSGRYGRMIEMLPQLEESFAQRGFATGLLVAALARFEAGQGAGKFSFDQLVEQAREIVRLAETTSPKNMTAAMWLVADLIRRSGDMASISHLARLIAAQAELARSEDAGDMLCVAAMLGGASEGVAFAEPLATRAIELTKGNEDPVTNARALFAHGTTMLWKGNLLQADLDYSNALQFAVRWGPEGLLHSIQSNYAVVKMERSEFSMAEELAKSVIDDSRRRNTKTYSYCNLALIYIRQGRIELARDTLTEMIESEVGSVEPWVNVHVEALVGTTDLLMGDGVSAVRRAKSVRHALLADRHPGDSSHLHLLVAKLDSINGDAAAAANRLLRAGRELSSRDFIPGSRLVIAAAELQHSLGLPWNRQLVERLAEAAHSGGASLLFSEAVSLLKS
jgi:DNA-binding SARP family transcriptional activator